MYYSTGGCLRPCEYRMKCGHQCTSRCHPYDARHEKIRCLKPCPKKCAALGHPCKHRCCQCTEKGSCLPCAEPVDKFLPACGHTAQLACCTSVEEHKCTQSSTRELKCGHLSQRTCYDSRHNPELELCTEVVDTRVVGTPGVDALLVPVLCHQKSHVSFLG